MKKVIGILALLVFAGNIASAELLKDFKWDGKITANGYSTKNNNDADSDGKDTTSDVDTRVELNVGFNLTEDVDAVITAVKDDRSYAGGAQSAGGVADLFMFEQAYLNLKGVLGLDHKVGRQYYGEEGDLIIHYGPSASFFDTTAGVYFGNELNVSGVDGFSAWYKSDKLNINALTAKIVSDRSFANLDTDVVGIEAKYNLMSLLNIGGFVYEKKEYQDFVAAPAGSADTTMDVVGLRADGKIEDLKLNYYGILAKNYGHDHAADENFTGTGFLAGAKMDIELAGKWSFTGEMARGSGDDDGLDDENNVFGSIASDYRPGMIWGGVKGNVGIGNLTAWNLGAKWNTPMFEKLTLGANLHHLSYTEEVTAGVGLDTDTIGNELDVCANWQHNENVGLKAYYAAFMPTSDYAKYDAASLTANDDMTTLLGLALSVKF